MLEDMRRYVREGLGMLGGQSSDDVTENVRGRVQAVAEQMSSLAAGFLGWSAEARASLLREVRDLVTRQVKEMGVATREEVDALRARIQELERPGSAARASPRAGPTKAATKRKSSRTTLTKSEPSRTTLTKRKPSRTSAARGKSGRPASIKRASGRKSASSRSGGAGRPSPGRGGRSPRSAST